MKGSSLLAGLASAAALAAGAADTPAPAAAEYQDRLIDPAELVSHAAEDATTYNAEGLPREWRVEAFGSYIDQGGGARRENGLVMSGTLDTLQFGALSVNGVVRNNSNSSVFTLWQRGMPFDQGWRANNAVGMVNTSTIDLSRQQFRFFLPTFPIAGLQTEWLQAGNVQLQASAGAPGLYDGLRLPGFSRLGGSIFTGGAQWLAAPHLQAGIQFADARDVRAGLEPNDPEGRTSARSVYGVAAWADGGDRMQFNVLDSQSGAGRHNIGAWLDGETRQGRYLHNYGVFRFDPNLSWGYAPINRDVQGAYYRVNYQSQQWIWAAGADLVSAVSERDGDGAFLTGNVRYQVDQSLGIGGGGSLRRSGSTAGSAYAFLDQRTRFGTSRMQLDVVSAQGPQHAEQVTLDHAFPTQVGLRLSTSLSLGREVTAERERAKRATIAGYGGIDITDGLSIDGSLRFSVERGPTRSNGRYANLGLVWRLTPRWSVVASYYDNRSELQDFATLASVLPVVQGPVAPRDRAVFLTVRYEERAGTPIAPLGGMPGSGAGVLSGQIYYDANDDGRRGANESGAANVTVVIDGRYATRTDAEGRFEFPVVAPGPHVVTVVPDNLALPYAIRGDGKRQVIVRTRETTTLDFAATKLQ